MLDILIKNNININLRDKQDWTILHTSIYRQRMDLTKRILSYNVDVNLKTEKGNTPLHFAASYYTYFLEVEENKKFALNVIKRLLKKGARVNLRANDGMTPLHCAARRGLFSVAKLLIKNGAKLNVADEQGITPLMYVIQLGTRIKNDSKAGMFAPNEEELNNFYRYLERRGAKLYLKKRKWYKKKN